MVNTMDMFLYNIRKTTANILIILLLFGFSMSLQAVEIAVSVDRNPVNINESFQVTFSATDSPDDDPDFSSLAQEFEILNRSQSTQSSWVNGKSSKTINWILQLMAKRAGTLTIPAIAFGADNSRALAILVNQSGASQNSDQVAEDLFMQVDASPKNPYVQAQVIYTLKLFRKINLAQASLTEPEVTDAVIVKLDEDRNYNTRFNNEDYIVTERKYAIFPQQSGIVTIAPISLTAAVIVNNQRRRFSGFFNQQTTRTRRIVSEAITLNVLAMPKQQQTQGWLPAEQVYLEQKWSADIDQLVAGEPVTRTVTLLAKGTTVGQLPELNTAVNPIHSDSGGQLKNYPDQPVLKEQKKADGVIAFREQKIAFIPSKAGTYHLPEIVIPWWNVNTQALEKATIPAAALTASAAIAELQEQPVITANISENKDAEVAPVLTEQSDNHWILLTTLLACGWLATTLYFLFRRQKKQVEQTDNNRQQKQHSILKTLKRACKNNDALAAKDALIRWGQQNYQVSSLGKIGLFCDQKLANEIQKLNSYLYSKSETTWNAEKLLLEFEKYQSKDVKMQKNNEALEPLHRL